MSIQFTSVFPMEKRITELEESVKVLAKYMKTELEKVEQLKHQDHRAPVEDKVAMMSAEVAEMRKLLEKQAQYAFKEHELTEAKEKSLEELLNDVEPLERRLEKEMDDEDVERVSIDKNISDVRQRIAELENNVRKLAELEVREENLSRNVEKISQRFLAAGLAEFSKDLDRMYPTLATKTEFEKFAAQLERKIDTIEVPDMSHIERKVNDLENKVLRLLNIVEDIYNRLPAVVE